MKGVKVNNFNINKFFKSKVTRTIIALTLIYLLFSLYFVNHFFFHTVINGVDVSLKAYDEIDNIIKDYAHDYELELIERKEKSEKIIGKDIELQYNEKNSISKIYHLQNSFKWISSLLKDQKYYVNDLFVYDKNKFEDKVNGLNCLHKEIIQPQNVSFKYSNNSYKIIKEVYGNKINKEKLLDVIKTNILKGEIRVDLHENLCYQNPEYTSSCNKTIKTKNLLNRYVKAKITYLFGSKKEIIEGNSINEWFSVDENLEIAINEIAVMEYVRVLSKKYDTVGVARNFKTSTGKIVEVKGGLYGWKINVDAETKALLQNIKLGKIIEKEPIYSQKAFSRDGNEIGNTYVEINITRQYIWFYKEGRLITQGTIVTGNPNKGHSTKVGTYMLNYKQKWATLRGPGYEAKIIYWMPFYGNIGIHDARWRYSFGGKIYMRNGSHGCVNVPVHIAKTVFENIEKGTPIICYEE